MTLCIDVVLLSLGHTAYLCAMKHAKLKGRREQGPVMDVIPDTRSMWINPT